MKPRRVKHSDFLSAGVSDDDLAGAEPSHRANAKQFLVRVITARTDVDEWLCFERPARHSLKAGLVFDDLDARGITTLNGGEG